MTSSKLIKLLNGDNNLRELFRVDPIGVLSEHGITIGEAMEVVSKLKHTTFRDLDASRRVAEWIVKNGPELTRRTKDSGEIT